MPHRVSTFLRNSSTSIEAQVASLKKATVRRPSPNPRSSTSSLRRSSLHRPSSYASSVDDDASAASDEMPAAAPLTAAVAAAAPAPAAAAPAPASRAKKTMAALPRASSAERRDAPHAGEHHHRLSFGGLHFGRASRESQGNPNLALDWKIESPPIVLYNDAESSTGALVSGLLFLTVKDEPVRMDSFAATLTIHTTQKRPYTAHCHDCIHQYTELQKWSFLQGPVTLAKGQHGFPFSVLLAGHLPASMDGPLVSIAYEFRAEALPSAAPPADAAAAGPPLPVKLEKLFDVKRSLPAPELPHHSVRIFPPTNIKASVHFPQVIYPIGQNTLSLRIDGVTRLNAKVNTLEFWKLKKLTWRLEETCKVISPACPRHMPLDARGADEAPAAAVPAVPAVPAAAAAAAAAPAAAATEDEAATAAAAAAAAEPQPPKPVKGTPRTDTRIIGEKTLLSGWKSNYAGPDDSTIELELDYMLGKNAKYACDTRTRDGTTVTHQLMLEMVVSQEWAPANKPAMVTQTGVGRILRMHFTDILTERGGIGVSWDNEAPPIYQDVPPSPPSYCEEIRQAQAVLPEHIEPLDGVRSRP